MGNTCTFFGHRDCPETVKPKLREVLIDLIENQSVDTFYVGNKGAFDRIVCSVLRELAQEYPQTGYAVVLERMPGKRSRDENEDYFDTVLPEGIESVLPRFAILWRNEWIVRQSDFVVCYVTHTWGGAYQAVALAKRKQLKIINLV